MGRFMTPLRAELQQDRKSWVLLDSFQYLDDEAGLVTVPVGFLTDFASVPRLPLTFALVGAYGHAAAALHDWMYASGKYSRKQSDKVFKNALRSSGIARWRAWIMWTGVRVGGSRRYAKNAHKGKNG